jgi:nucleoside-diphosphate-sugar epimerase
MRICLVGGLGTLGSDIVDAYHAKHQLLIIDDEVESCMAINELPVGVLAISANAANKEAYFKALHEFNPELVVYLATTVSSDQFRGFESVQGLANICEAGINSSNFPILYVQSFLTREVGEPVNAASPICARESYGIWKMAGEYLLQNYPGKKTTVILSSVVSPRINVGAIPAFTKRILAGEDLTVTDTFRDYLSPSDFISFLDLAIASENWPRECVVGSSKAISTKEIAESVAEALNVPLSSFSITVAAPKVTDPKFVIFDTRETEKVFVWKPVADIKNSIANCVNSIQSTTKDVRQHH